MQGYCSFQMILRRFVRSSLMHTRKAITRKGRIRLVIENNQFGSCNLRLWSRELACPQYPILLHFFLCFVICRRVFSKSGSVCDSSWYLLLGCDPHLPADVQHL